MSTSNIEISAAKPYNGLGSSCPKYDNKPLRLIQVHTAFRHGARTPMNDLGKQPVHWTLEEQDKTSFSLAQFTLYQHGNGSPIPRTSILGFNSLISGVLKLIVIFLPFFSY